jgi:diaminohydroxyphosphoribosylaminopyrimidine deaminase/5-amino-6-(5-phosphoribosylamino)uracil reductase
MGEGGRVTRRVDDNMVSERRAEELMRRAVALAAGTNPHPNPRVGAIVLSPDGRVQAARAHAGPGAAHAEAAALEEAGPAARGGTLIVTLEPCTHHGHTPPCADAVIDSGIARVVVGATDPDDRVSGAGVRRLSEAGIEVIAGVAAADVHAADPGYFHHRRTGRPRVTLKMAMTLDGQVAAADGTSQWITGREARADAHRLRASVDAVMIGAGTLRSDDPRLDVRLDGYDGPQPLPIVVAGSRPLPVRARLYLRNPLVYSPTDQLAVPDGVEVVSTGAADAVDLDLALKDLGARGVVDLLVEGGPTLAAALLHRGLADTIIVYVGSTLAGGTGVAPFAGVFSTIEAARPVQITNAQRLGADIRIDAAVREES